MDTFIIFLSIVLFIIVLQLVRDAYVTRLYAQNFDHLDDYADRSEIIVPMRLRKTY
jgi:hypothetical protein